jgi:hypothetical protein
MLLDTRAEEATGYSPWSLTAAWFGSGDESHALARYLDQLHDWLAPLDPDDDNPTLFDGEVGKVPPVPDDLEAVLALSALAGPATCAYRALSRHFGTVPVTERVRCAGGVAEAMVSLLNSWEATRIIDASATQGDYWYKSLQYCADGNLQSLFDEYVAMLVEWRGYDRQGDRPTALQQVVDDMSTALTLRTAVYRVLRAEADRSERETLRGRFAVRFGDADSEEQQQQQRVDAVSLAFNSPFWPFVLTSTSVGQEGLDFHLYCHAVSHWNLPGNPVDLEQREGRVHRYKGHAIRKNVALAVGPPSGTCEPWGELFALAAASGNNRTSDLVPYWVYLPDHVPESQLSRIERHLPITPYSREASRIDPLLASVAYYRLAFGQPRQEELLAHVLTNVTDDALRTALAGVRVDLSPPRSSESA